MTLLLEEEAVVALPACEPLTVEKLQERDGMLSGQGEQVFEFGDTELGTLGKTRAYLLLHFFQNETVIGKVLGYLHKNLLFDHPEINPSYLLRISRHRT